MRASNNITSNFYPETMGVCYVINTGWFFSIIWAFVKKIIDPKTLEKIKVFGADYKAELEKDVDIKNLPKFLGGEKEIDLEEGDWSKVNPGPWNKP